MMASDIDPNGGVPVHTNMSDTENVYADEPFVIPGTG